MKTISLKFDGYWREVNKSGIPAESGIYGVYVCTYNKEQNTVFCVNWYMLASPLTLTPESAIMKGCLTGRSA